MEEYQEKFLAAEKAASDMVTDLENIKQAIEKYKTSADLFEETHEYLKTLSGEINSVVISINNYIEELKGVGIDAILEEINNANSQASEIYKRLQIGVSISLILLLIIAFQVFRN